MINQDYLQDDNGDILIQNGDFIIGLSDNQHIEDIFQEFQGERKQFPFSGVGILSSLNAADVQGTINRAKAQLQAAGYQVDLLDIYVDSSSKLRIEFPNGIVYNG